MSAVAHTQKHINAYTHAHTHTYAHMQVLKTLEKTKKM